MTDFATSLDTLFDADAKQHPTQTLVRNGLQKLCGKMTPALLLFADQRGKLITSEQLSVDLTPGSDQVAASTLASVLRNAGSDQVIERIHLEGAQNVVALAKKVTDGKKTHGFIAVACPADQQYLFQDEAWLEQFNIYVDAAWNLLMLDVELREAETRIRHLDAERETIRRDHSDIVTRVLEEREERLREKRQHISELEREVARRSQDLHAAMCRAEAANRAKSEFLANMSHEIRTPMNAILGFSEQLLTPSTSPEEQRLAVETIHRNSAHLLEIINDILDLSKIEAGKLVVDLEPCVTRTVIEDAVNMLRERAESKHLTLNIEFADNVPYRITTDSKRLRQILLNLVGNAIKFTAHGSVQVNVRREIGGSPPHHLIIDVIDSGIGMTTEEMSRLFQPFTQADTSTTRKFGGTGLGLTISRRLARLLSGDLVVESWIGQGSKFTIMLDPGVTEDAPPPSVVLPAPTLQTNGSVHGQPNIPAPSPASATKKDTLEGRILVVDDGPDNRRLVELILKKAGATVSTACDGAEAVKCALESRTAEPFNLILMDMQMPVLDGYDATRRLRDEGWEGPIIAFTAHAMQGDRERCLAAGCDDYLSKPINRRLLFEVIQRYLAPTPTRAN